MKRIITNNDITVKEGCLVAECHFPVIIQNLSCVCVSLYACVCVHMCEWMHINVFIHLEVRVWRQVSSFTLFYLFVEKGSLTGAHNEARLTHQQVLPIILPLFPMLGVQTQGHLCFLCNCWGFRLRSLCPHGKHFIHWTHLPSHSFKTTFWQVVESKGRRGIRMHR